MPKEILIAGSDITDQGEFQKIFESTDYHLVFSDKAEEALLRIKLFKPDLIIASTALSGRGGMEFCEIVKLDPEFKDIPVILVAGILEEITERDRMRVKADGIISQPLMEGEVLNLVEGFMERETLKLDEEITGARKEWKPRQGAGELTDDRKEGLFLDDMGDITEEEIIELVDVVEEPEPIMSIDDFVTAKQEEPYGEISVKESSEKVPEEEDEKPYGELDFLTFDEKEIETKDEAVGAAVREDIEKKGKAAPALRRKEASPDEELFEKINLEEILAKVEQIQPSIDKEWPQEKEVEETRTPEPVPSAQEEVLPEKLFSIEEFEYALKEEVKDETPAPDLKPFSFEESEKEAPAEMDLEELPLEEEELKEVVEEEFPEDIFEEMLEEEEIKAVEELKAEEIKEEEIEAVEELKAEEIEEEEIKVLEELKAEELGEEEITALGGFKTEELKEETVIEEPKPAAFDFFEEKIAPALHVVKPKLEPPEPLHAEEKELFEAMEAPRIVPEIREEIISPMIKTVEKQLEEVIAKGVQDMIGDFITKILPEMTQNIMNLTADRIEKMVREVVPELAEKAIQEEIKKIQKEVKG